MHATSLSCNASRSDSPAARVIRLFGSADASAIAGLTTDALRKWERPISKGGGGGLIPARYQSLFLDAARERGLALTAADLVAAPAADRVPEDVQ